MNLKLILALGLSALLAAACWLSYHAGQNTTELKYQKVLTDLSAQSEKYRKQSEDKIHDLEVNRIAQNQDADTRLQALRKRLDVALKSKPSVSIPAGVGDRGIADDVVRVLAETASDPYLKPPKHSSCLVAESGAVTTDNLSEYAFTTIENYNSCARQLNSLIDVVGALYKNSP